MHSVMPDCPKEGVRGSSPGVYPDAIGKAAKILCVTHVSERSKTERSEYL